MHSPLETPTDPLPFLQITAKKRRWREAISLLEIALSAADALAMRVGEVLALTVTLALAHAAPGKLAHGIIRGAADEREVQGSRVVELVKHGKRTTVSTSQLFDEPYRPQDSRHFNAVASQTFSADVARKFDLSYADGTELSGFQGSDVVELGDFHAHAPFGVITDCNSPDFNGVDGILGFGLPKPQYFGNALPEPILFALTDKNSEGASANTRNLPRKFSFFSTDTEAEVQLGGYDPRSVTGPMQYVNSITHSDFSVPVTSLTFGKPGGAKKELLQFTSHGGSLPGVMDSGTSCLVIPADHVGGQLKNVPWDDFVDQWAEGKSFWITIGGTAREIPFKQWYLADSEQTCVQPSPDGMEGLLVGDVFFREYMVEFDMRNQNAPIIGIAPLNKHYAPIRTKQFDFAGLKEEPAYPTHTKLVLTKGHAKMYPKEHFTMLAEIDRIPVVNQAGTQYFMDVKIGTPAQTFTVIFDTGSNVFGVFTYKNQLPAAIRATLEQTRAVHLRADPENILMLTGKPKSRKGKAAVHAVEQQGVAVSLAMAGSDLASGVGAGMDQQSSAMSFGVGVLLLAIVANVLAGVHLVSRRTRARSPAASNGTGVVALPQYAAVSTAPCADAA